jgi:hypothetical protein
VIHVLNNYETAIYGRIHSKFLFCLLSFVDFIKLWVYKVNNFQPSCPNDDNKAFDFETQGVPLLL